MFKSKLFLGFTGLMSILATSIYAEPKIEVHGDADADVWYDATSNKGYNSHDVNVTVTGKITENISATIGVTSVAGTPPADLVSNADRWGTMDFDGAWVDWNTSIEGLSFSIGDLVYTFGGFNYYLYKNKGMITSEIFPRGLQAVYDMGSFSITAIGGAKDDEAGSLIAGGIIGFKPSDMISANATIITTSADSNTDINAGLSTVATLGPANIKLDFAYITQGDSVGMNLLIEPSASFGNFSVASTFFMKIKDESIEQDVTDDMFVYVEPGYSFSDNFAFGLPLEYHDTDLDVEKDESIWVVPTVYIYPAKNLEWWLWGGSFIGDTETSYSVGSEVIFSF